MGRLVAITPAAGYVTPGSAVLIGAVAGLACYWGATGLKRLLNTDDSLDVFGVHGIGGIVGSLMTGLLASKAISGVSGSVAVQLLVGLRVDEQSEITGLDITQHREHMGS